MGLEGLGLGFLWNWGSSEGSQGSQNEQGRHVNGSRDRKKKKKAVRTRKEQLANGSVVHGGELKKQYYSLHIKGAK